MKVKAFFAGAALVVGFLIVGGAVAAAENGARLSVCAAVAGIGAVVLAAGGIAARMIDAADETPGRPDDGRR